MTASGPLQNGAQFGSYTILRRIGAGGMGEVYRAHDPRLKRDVAIKVVRTEIATADRVARLRREARVLASLSHPNVAGIFGIDDSTGTTALIMELVDGPTLADRLSGAMPTEESLRAAARIAEALEYAHERGIVHRDLKPANIKFTPEGTVKVLDFGLAKALAPDTPEGGDEQMPTVSHPPTEAGVVLGTPAYMSPEQASGRPVDRRTDIWAFGSVLYEMLTGTRAFAGETTADTVAALMRSEPDWSLLPDGLPADIATLLRRCLRKDPRQRLQAIGDARIAIEDVLAGTAAGDDLPRVGHRSPRRLAWAAAGVIAVAMLAGLAGWSLRPPPRIAEPVRTFTVALPAGLELASLDAGALALSQDGSQLAYVARHGTEEAGQLYVRAMDTGETTPLVGTEGATTPFFSPDGQWIGFFAEGKLKKVPLGRGPVSTVAVVPIAFGGAWLSTHQFVFASLWSELQQVADSGGPTHAATAFQGGENSHTWPVAVPGRRSILFAASGPASRAIAIQRGDGVGHDDVMPGGDATFHGYVPPGYLTFQQGGNLMAVPFDAEQGHVVGNAVVAVPHVLQYAVSASGTLAYAAGSQPETKSRLAWVTREGAATIVDDRADNYYVPRLDPSRDDRVAMDLKGQVWMFDLATRNLAPFTFEDLNQHAVWTRDGQRLVFMTQRGRTWQLSTQRADGSGRPERLAEDAGLMDIPYSLSPGGELAFVKYSPTAAGELWVLPVQQPATAGGRLFSIPLADADAGPVFSPDGRWLAYAASDAAGRRQIYVQAYPGPGGKHQVSIDGGNEPMWNPHTDGQALELFYRNGDAMMAVSITTKPSFSQQKPHRLFLGASRYQAAKSPYVRPNYDVSHDGQRFLMLQNVGAEQPPVTDIHVVLNWPEQLKRSAPAKQ